MRVGFLFVSLAVLATSVFAQDVVKRYTIKSGEVHYKISGGGNLMGVKFGKSGEKTLLFKDYGTLQFEEEKTTEISDGKTKKEHTMSKIDNTTIYTVHFQFKKIIAMTDPMASKYLGKNMGEDAQNVLKGFGGKKIGKDKVLGFDCNIWTIMGAKQCLYKDQVPLWLEVNMMGLVTKQEAVSVKFNHSISDSKFKLPNFDIDKSGIMSIEDIKKSAKMNEAIKRATKKAKQQSAQGLYEQAMVNAMMEALGEDEGFKQQFAQMKSQMPKTLNLAKGYRACLKDASSKSAALSCKKSFSKKAEEMGLDGDNEDDFGSWSPSEKKAYLKDLDKDIKDMETALPCIQKAKNPAQMMQCEGLR